MLLSEHLDLSPSRFIHFSFTTFLKILDLDIEKTTFTLLCSQGVHSVVAFLEGTSFILIESSVLIHILFLSNSLQVSLEMFLDGHDDETDNAEDRHTSECENACGNDHRIFSLWI